MKYIILLNVFILLIINNLAGQEHSCHADVNLERSSKIQRLLNQSNTKNYSGETPMIRLVLHNVHQDDGSEGFSWAQIRTVVQGVSGFFSPLQMALALQKVEM